MTITIDTIRLLSADSDLLSADSDAKYIYAAWGVDQEMGWLYTSYGHMRYTQRSQYGYVRYTLLRQFHARRVRDWEFSELNPTGEMFARLRGDGVSFERPSDPTDESVPFPASSTNWPRYLAQWETVESTEAPASVVLPGLYGVHGRPVLPPLYERVPPGTTAAVLAAYESGSRPPEIEGWGTSHAYRSALELCLLDSLPLALRAARLACIQRTLHEHKYGSLRAR